MIGRLAAAVTGSRGGDDVPVLIVFERNGGLTALDLDAIGRIGNGWSCSPSSSLSPSGSTTTSF